MPERQHHVIFGPSAAGTLRSALDERGVDADVVCLFDNFSFGPIASDDGHVRVRWVEEVLSYTGWQDVVDSNASVLAASSLMVRPPIVWISTRNTAIYAGFLWWLSHVGDLPCSIVNVAELNILNPEGMAELFGSEVPLTPEDRAGYHRRWRELRVEDAPLRVIDGDDLVSAPIDHFDQALLALAAPEWQKMARIIASALVQFMDAGVFQTGDLVLGARLRDLGEAGVLEWRGDLSHMQRCELRLPQLVAAGAR